MNRILSILMLISCALNLRAQEVPSYFMENGYLDAKIASVPKGSSFIYITDTHFPRSTRKSTPVLKYVKEKLGVQTVVFGGDVVDWNPTKEEAAAVVKEYFDELYALAGKDLIWVHGNHDSNSAAVTKYNYPEETSIISDTEVYDMTVANYADQLVFDEELIEAYRTKEGLSDYQREQALAYLRMHYYRDDVRNKIRYIVFDTIDNGPTTRHTLKGKKVLSVQLPFIRKAMDTTPKGYSIVLLAHTMGHHKHGIMDGEFHAPLYREVADFRKTHDNKVILIGGHQHVDAALAITCQDDGTILNEEPDNKAVIARNEVLTVWVNRDAHKARMAKWAAGGRDCELKKSVSPIMKPGTVTEVSFDVVTLTKKGVVFTRIGAGEDREFRFAKK